MKKLILIALFFSISFSSQASVKTSSVANKLSSQTQDFIDFWTGVDPNYKCVIYPSGSLNNYAKCYLLPDNPCDSGDIHDPATSSCNPDPCADSPDPAQCSCENEGKFYSSLGGCQDIPNCTSEEVYDSIFNLCTDSNGCTSGYSQDINGECVPDSEPDPENPQPEPDPDPDPEPDPEPQPDPDGPQSEDPNADLDNDGTPNASDLDIDGDGVNNSEDPDSVQKVDLSGVESRINTTNEKLASIDSKTSQGNANLKKIETNTSNTSLLLSQTNSTLEHQNNLLTAGLGKTNKTLSSIEKHLLEEPDSVASRTSSTATIGETNTRINNLVFENSFISDAMTIPTVATSTSCPMFSIPSTQYWSSLPIDICTPLESNRAVLSNLFIGLWSLVAVMVFLKA